MQRQYTKEELTGLQAELYDILGEIDRVCRKNGLRYFLIGGSAIGAFYDKAILPWDDDIDIGMPRDDYNRLLRIAKDEFRSQYFLSWQGTDPRVPFYFAKLKKNGTLFSEKLFAHLPMHQGIYVDIFPFDSLPDNAIVRKIHRAAVNFLKCCLIGKEVWMWRHCGRCEIDNPTNRTFLPCLLTRIVCTLLSKRAIYRLMVGTQSLFNRRKTLYLNNIITTTDRIPRSEAYYPTDVAFGPLTVMAPPRLEAFLRHNFPTLHRFTPEEVAQITNHCPEQLVLSGQKE